MWNYRCERNRRELADHRKIPTILCVPWKASNNFWHFFHFIYLLFTFLVQVFLHVSTCIHDPFLCFCLSFTLSGSVTVREYASLSVYLPSLFRSVCPSHLWHSSIQTFYKPSRIPCGSCLQIIENQTDCYSAILTFCASISNMDTWFNPLKQHQERKHKELQFFLV